MYSYLAITNNCNCETYAVSDEQNHVDYRFRAHYAMERGIVTHIEVELVNNSNSETLSTDRASVKVSSRNIAYQYNNMFLPVPPLSVEPKNSDVVTLRGRQVTEEEDWNKIAGEQLTITIKGIMLGEKELPQQSVSFVPDNPKLGGR